MKLQSLYAMAPMRLVGAFLGRYKGAMLLLGLAMVALYKIVHVYYSTTRDSWDSMAIYINTTLKAEIEEQEWLVQDYNQGINNFSISTDPVWILTLRIQKTGSSSLERFIKQWLEQHHPSTSIDPSLKCNVLRSCRTVHSADINGTWDETPPCTCDVMDTIVNENQDKATRCRAINGPHADMVDLTSWFQAGGTCSLAKSKTINPTTNDVVPHAILTMLRDPVDRVVSEFKFICGWYERYPRWIRAWDYGCWARNLTQYLDNPECGLGSFNRLTRMIAGHGSNRRWQDVYHDDPYLMLETAKENLRTKVHLGLLEYWEESIQLFQHVLSTLRQVENRNDTNYIDIDKELQGLSTMYKGDPKRRTPNFRVNERTREKVERLNSLDRELYDYATVLFWKRYCTAFPQGRHAACQALNESISQEKK